MKIFKIMPLLTAMLLMSGCTFGSSIESLLSPPTLSEEQAEIYQALTDKVGNKVSLKYPKTGDYLSAFVIDNIDDEPTDEAIVFYERNGITVDEISLRINILDKRNGVWTSVYDSSANGTEVEKVIISKLGSSSENNIIVGYSMSQGEKNLAVYQYDEGILTQDYSDTYSLADVCDVDNDNQQELIVIRGNTASESAQAQLLKRDSDGIYSKYRTQINEAAIDYSQYLYSGADNDMKTIVIDSVIGPNTILTEVLSPTMNEGLKQNLAQEETTVTIRPSSYNSMDIDGDGIIEIPATSFFPGYAELTETEQVVTMTNWLVYENNRLTRKYSGYYSINEGYSFMLPEKWIDKVTVKTDPLSEEIVFYKFENSLDESTEEIMRISVINSADDIGKVRAGYRLVHSKGETLYYVYIAEKADDELKPDISDILCGFKFI